MSWPFVSAGETVSLRVPNVRDAAGALVDLSTASAMVFTTRRRARDPFNLTEDADNPIVLQKTAVAYDGVGNVNALVSLVAADTRDLADWYFADLWVTIGGVPLLVKADRWEIKQVARRA